MVRDVQGTFLVEKEVWEKMQHRVLKQVNGKCVSHYVVPSKELNQGCLETRHWCLKARWRITHQFC